VGCQRCSYLGQPSDVPHRNVRLLLSEHLSSIGALIMTFLCYFHRNDYVDSREGNRVVGVGEKPYFDPAAKSRRDDLSLSLA
jgi:hypothetical protein